MPESPPWRTYVDSQTLFNLQVPPDWTVDNSGQNGTRVILLSPRLVKDFRPNVNVMVHELGGLEPQEYLRLTRLQYTQITGQPWPARDEPAPFYPGGHLFEALLPSPAVSLKIMQLVVFSGGKAFVITGTAPAEVFPVYSADFETVCASFQKPATP